MQTVAGVPPLSNQVLIAANPKAGSGGRKQLLEQLVVQLSKRGLIASILTQLDDTVSQANELAAAGKLRALVAAGGDGTASLLVHRTSPQVPILVFPLGTENLLAHYLHLRSKPEQAAQVIQDGHTLCLDAGSANGRAFLLMISCGFDADVVERLHHRRQ